jgi:hypothetical protein
MKNLLLVIAFCITLLHSKAQIGTDFWIAPPDVTDLNDFPGGEPIYLFLQSQSASDATVTITQPANGSFVPIVVTVFAGKSRRVNLSPFKTALETRPTNTILNTGLRIQSTQVISVQYEIYNFSNNDITALRGDNANGTYFYIPLHKHAPFFNHTYSAPHIANSSFDIVATQNGTTVRFYTPVPADGHPAIQQFAITLNAGQTYSCGYTGTNYEQPSTHVAGTVVMSDKPVAITVKGDSEHNPSGSCTDLQFEQIVPVSKLGTDHIAVKGSLNNTGDESVVITAVVNGTEIYLDGASTPVAILFAGEYYRVDIDYLSASANNSVYIHASQPIYATHISGFGCEMGDALLPPLTYGTTSISLMRNSAETFYVELVTRTTNTGSFTITGPGTATINPLSFVVVPGTGGTYSAARIQFNTTQFPVDSSFTIQNSGGSFLVGMLNGGASTGARFTYLSPFGSSGALPLRNLQLSGRIENDGNQLDWSVVEDGNEYRYDLQLQQPSGWITVETKQSGNNSASRSYGYRHRSQVQGARVYRVAATEISTGHVLYSNIIKLNRSGGATMNIYPNPAREQLQVQLSRTNGSIDATLYTVTGQIARQQQTTGNSFTIDLKTLERGIYLLSVTDGTNQWQEKVTVH